jgi:LacI family transcriptional regulator
MVTDTTPIDSARSATRRPTMKDVATLAGVSLSTVSRVVNGDPGRPDLAERIQDAIGLLGYERDLTASTLRRSDRASASIGLLLTDVGNPFFASVMRGVEDVARLRGSVTVAGSSDEDLVRERELAGALAARRVDGMIIVPAGGDQSYLRQRMAHNPVVFLDRPPSYLDADTVLSDNAGGISIAVDHLVRHGHRRIAYLGGIEPLYTSAERLRGYREALVRNGLPVDATLIRTNLRTSAASAAAARGLLALATPPTALVAGQNLITIGVVHALRSLRQQHRIALVGFDDVPLADALDPAITVVAQRPIELGRRAAELLFSRVDGYSDASRSVIVPTELVVRGSGELPPQA